MPGQAGFSYGYRFCRMPKLSGHWPGLPSAPSPRPGAQREASVVQSPRFPCCHQLSMAACASTRSSSTPHLQAAQRRISRVVPVNCPSTRGATLEFALGSSPVKNEVPMEWPVVAFARLLALLFSGKCFARTHNAHCAPEGSAAPGGRVVKRTGAPAAVLFTGAGDALDAAEAATDGGAVSGGGRGRRPGGTGRAGALPSHEDRPARGDERHGADDTQGRPPQPPRCYAMPGHDATVWVDEQRVNGSKGHLRSRSARRGQWVTARRAWPAKCSGTAGSPPPWPARCSRISSAKVCRLLRASRAVPSGWWQAPRPVTRAAACSARRTSSGCRSPRASRRSRSASQGRPFTHGPHWPALWLARYARMRALSTSPHADIGSATTTPAPGDAPSGLSAARDSSASPRTAAGSHAPWYPPTSTARSPAVEPPASVSRWRRAAPCGTSYTPVAVTAPLTVARNVPGSSGVPSSRNQAAPWRTSNARWASVSTFCTRVGRPCTPLSTTRRGVSLGSAARPSTADTTADSSPETNRSGEATTVTATRSQPAADRSARARCTLSAGAPADVYT